MTLRRSLYLSLVLSIVLCGIGAEAQNHSCTNCFSDVTAGEVHTCAIREHGSLACWGYDFFGQATVPELDPEWYDVVQVSSGGYHTCAVIECTPPPGHFCVLGNGWCWG
ncbi:MAG: RCC1 domain-containing protein, partial [Acidobacteriota bacterium]